MLTPISPTQRSMVKRLAVSWLGGMAILGGLWTLYLLIGSVRNGSVLEILFGFFPNILGVVGWGAFFTWPLFLVALAVGIFFQNSIEKHPLPWCLAVMPVSWTVGTLILTVMGVFSFEPSQDIMEQVYSVGTKDEALVCLLGPIPSVILFYLLTKRAQRKQRA